MLSKIRLSLGPDDAGFNGVTPILKTYPRVIMEIFESFTEIPSHLQINVTETLMNQDLVMKFMNRPSDSLISRWH